MSAPPKPWERPRVQTQAPPIANITNPSPQILQGSISGNAPANTTINAQAGSQMQTNSTLGNSMMGNSMMGNSMMGSTGMYGRRSMMGGSYGSSYGSSMYRPGMYGMGGMGMGGYGGMGMGMGGMGMGMGGMGYGGYGEPPSKGMMAIERFSILVSSLCFTAETIENSMHSMGVF